MKLFNCKSGIKNRKEILVTGIKILTGITLGHEEWINFHVFCIISDFKVTPFFLMACLYDLKTGNLKNNGCLVIQINHYHF